MYIVENGCAEDEHLLMKLKSACPGYDPRTAPTQFNPLVRPNWLIHLCHWLWSPLSLLVTKGHYPASGPWRRRSFIGFCQRHLSWENTACEMLPRWVMFIGVWKRGSHLDLERAMPCPCHAWLSDGIWATGRTGQALEKNGLRPTQARGGDWERESERARERLAFTLQREKAGCYQNVILLMARVMVFEVMSFYLLAEMAWR